MRFEIHRQSDGPQFYWTIVGDNNESLATSKLYHNKSDIDAIIQRLVDWLGSVGSTIYAVLDKT